MVQVIICTVYPWGESDAVALALWPGYGCRDALEAHGWILELLTAGDERIEVLDADGELWSFERETVAAVLTFGDP